MATTDFGFDFRATSGYVTDPAVDAFCAGEDFPHTYTNGNSDTISAGSYGNAAGNGLYVNLSGGIRDRNSGNDARIAGLTQNNGNATTNGTGFFRITLPSTGIWNIFAAFGDASNSQNQYVKFLDNGSAFATYTNVATAGNSFMDANGNVYTAANWPSSSAILAHNFTSTTFDVQLGPDSPAGTNSTTIAHLRITKVPATFPPLNPDQETQFPYPPMRLRM